MYKIAKKCFTFRVPETDNIATFSESEGYVWHVEEDLFVPGNIIFSDIYALKTTDGVKASVIVGHSQFLGFRNGHGATARFGHIRSFIQLSAIEAVLLDTGNRCLRRVDRRTNVTTTYAGECGKRGYRDGVDALFYNPLSLTWDSKNSSQLILSENINASLRTVEIPGQRKVSTLLRHAPANIGCLLQESTTGDIYLTVGNAIGLFYYHSEKLTIIAGTADISGHYDGPFSLMLLSAPLEMQLFGPNHIVVADYGNSRLRILDMTTNTSSSICTGVQGYEDGNNSTCQLTHPSALGWIHATLYVGEYLRIRSLNYKGKAGYSCCYQF